MTLTSEEFAAAYRRLLEQNWKCVLISGDQMKISFEINFVLAPTILVLFTLSRLNLNSPRKTTNVRPI
jgi:hypothetical protein